MNTYISMKKKQVKALLEVALEDDSRPVLNGFYVGDYNGRQALVATDTYILVALYTEIDPKHTGKVLSREAVEQWRKNATAKDIFNSEALNELLSDDNNIVDQTYHKYPKWQELIPDNKGSRSQLSFNAKLTDTLQRVNYDIPLMYTLRERAKPITATNEYGLYLMMPMRTWE